MNEKLKTEEGMTEERRAFLKKAGAVALAAPATALLLSRGAKAAVGTAAPSINTQLG